MEIGAACAWAALAPALGFSALFALAAGPLIPFAILALASIAVPIAAAHVLLVWLPVWLLVSRWRRPGWVTAAALGFVCGAAPIGVIAWAGGWFDFAGSASALFGACGLVGGGTFWWRLERDRI
jgi:hypothetical protein